MRHRRLLQLLIGLISASFPAEAQSNNSSGFVEIGGSYGAALAPHVAQTAETDIGVGGGRESLIFQVGRTWLQDYANGFGTAATFSGVTISGSRLTDFSLNYRRDFPIVSGSKIPVLYGGGGLGYFKSRFTYTQVGCPIICFPFEPQVVSERNHINAFGLGLQGGVRVPLPGRLGIRAGVDVWRISGGTQQSSNPGFISATPDVLIRFTLGPYFRFAW